jgi:2-aminoethylphosphonate-pyruvate transaminase
MVRSEWTDSINLAETENRLKQDRELTHVIAVHHETTTGRLNDISTLGALCSHYNVALLLDAVSSFGGEEIDFRSWNLEGCAATANKCLHGVPGISFVLIRNDVFENRSSAATTLYLDLFRNYQEQSKGYPLFTPAIQVLYALQRALIELGEEGGWRMRQQRFQRLSQIVRAGLQRQGLRLLLKDERHYSCVLSSFSLPEAIPFEYLYNELKQSGFVIYPGQSNLFEKIFRVAVMGELSPSEMEDFLFRFSAAVERFNQIAV